MAVLESGDKCITDNGGLTIEFGRTYVVGAMNSFKDSYIDSDTHLIGICLKPATFANFYTYTSQDELTNHTVELEKANSFSVKKAGDNPFLYFDQFYSERLKFKTNELQAVIHDIHEAKGIVRIDKLAKKNYTTVRQLERTFKKLIGLSPKQYANIIRFRYALSLIRLSGRKRSFLDIAFECGYHDQSHLNLDIKRNTGLSPSLL